MPVTPAQFITVEIKQQYGNEAIYPFDRHAELFANMLGQKTLTRKDIDYIKALGFQVLVKQQEHTL